MRGFIAICLGDFLLAEINEMLSALPGAAGIKQVPVENLHLTLKFLGEIEGKPLEETVKILNTIAAETAAFTLELTGVGQFPRRGTPRNLWLGVKPSPALHALAERIGKEVRYGDDKPFSPHITLARVKYAGSEEDAYISALYRQKEFAFPKQRVTKFSLMESVLRPKAPEYSVGWDFILKDGAEK